MTNLEIELSAFDPTKNYVNEIRNIKKQAVCEYIWLEKLDLASDIRPYNVRGGVYYLDSEIRSSYREAKLLDIKKLDTTWREVYKVILSYRDSFIPGDAISLLVPNSDILVNKILKLLQKNGNEKISISYVKKGCNFNYNGTLRHFFAHVYDLRMFMKKAFLYELAQVSDLSNELYYLISNHGSSDYFSIISSSYSVLDIIERFKCNVTLEILLNNTELIKPRHYSFTNVKGMDTEIMIGLCYNSRKDRRVYGHVSEFIKYAQINDTLLCGYKNNILLNLQKHKNVLMIATGTGIAPFISFVRNDTDLNYWLLYACRTEQDNLSKDLDIRKNVLYSSESGDIKKYIIENIAKIKDFVQNEGAIYVCASNSLTKYLSCEFKEHFCETFESKKIFYDMWV